MLKCRIKVPPKKLGLAWLQPKTCTAMMECCVKLALTKMKNLGQAAAKNIAQQ
jgi:hypothetical protein